MRASNLIWATIAVCLVSLPAGLLYAPWILCFPYEERIEGFTVRSEAPLSAPVRREIERAHDLLEANDLRAALSGTDVYLTEGGWRWRLLAWGSVSAFGFRRSFGRSIVLNRTDYEDAKVRNGRSPGGVRSVGGLVAHEGSHLALARQYGELQILSVPKWIREGYADYVAQESSLSEAEAQALRVSRSNDIALRYFDDRRRVAAYLATPDHSVQSLLNLSSPEREGEVP